MRIAECGFENPKLKIRTERSELGEAKSEMIIIAT